MGYNRGMDNYNLLPENEYTEFENRRYLNPNLQVTQTNDFINNLRNTQQANNQEIRQQTYNLGTSVPSNLGGLVGGEGYWTSRYQTPQTNAVIQNLRTAAQAAALNQALANEQAMWKKRYQDAYNAYQKRQNNKTNTSSDTDDPTENVELIDSSKTIIGETPGVSGGYTVANTDTETGEVLGYTGVPYGEEGKTNYQYYFNNYSPANVPVVQHLSEGRTGQKIWSYKLPSGKLVPRSGGSLVVDENGDYYLSKNGVYTFVGN